MFRYFSICLIGVVISGFSLATQAEIPTKIIGFQQIFNPEQGHINPTLTINNVNPNLAIWVSLYYVGLKENDERDSFDEIVLDSQDIIHPNHPNAPFNIKLIADELPHHKNFSLTDYDDIVDLVEDEVQQTVLPVPTPASLNEKKIRVYGTIIDYAQDIDNKGVVNLSILNQQQQGLRPLAIYAIIGQGDKPEALSELTTSLVRLDGNGLPDPRGKAFGIIDPITRFMIFLVVAAALFFVYKKV